MNQLLDERPPGRPSFTEKQGQYLAFIWTYGLLNARPQPKATCSAPSGATAPSVHQMMFTLERSGLIRRQPGRARCIELLVEPSQPAKSSVHRY